METPDDTWKTADDTKCTTTYYFCCMGFRGRKSFQDYRCFFITTTCNNWIHLFKNDTYFRLLADSIIFCNKKYSANLIGYVFMPNHIHFIIYFEIENKLIDYMRDFKKFTSGEIRRKLEKDGFHEELNLIKYDFRKQKFKVWMDRFDDVIIHERETLETKLNYIHENPVRKGLVKQAEEYKYSSAAFYRMQQESVIPILHYMEVK